MKIEIIKYPTKDASDPIEVTSQSDERKFIIYYVGDKTPKDDLNGFFEKLGIDEKEENSLQTIYLSGSKSPKPIEIFFSKEFQDIEKQAQLKRDSEEFLIIFFKFLVVKENLHGLNHFLNVIRVLLFSEFIAECDQVILATNMPQSFLNDLDLAIESEFPDMIER